MPTLWPSHASRDGAGQRREQRALAGARQADDADLEGMTAVLARNVPLQRGERPMLERLHGALGLAEDRSRLAFEKRKTNFSVSTCRCSGESRSISVEHARLPERGERLLLRRALLALCRLRDFLLGLPAADWRGSGPSRGYGRSGRARPRTGPIATGNARSLRASSRTSASSESSASCLEPTLMWR